MTKKQAKLLYENFDIDDVLENEEEYECLKENNPELLNAYVALKEYAFSN